MTDLESYIKTYFGIAESDLEKIASLFEPKILAKNEYFTKPGKYMVSLSFVKSGFLRVYDIVGNKDITQWISSKGEFITDLGALIFKVPARRYIQAITDCEIYSLSYTDYKKIGNVVPQWTDLEKLFIAKCFISLEDRVFSFLSNTAEERFNLLYQHNKDLFNQVPLHFIASMLGMTPETLSRIRKKAIS